MSCEREMTESKKAMAYDLILILESNQEKQQYTPEEIKAMINAYIAGLVQK